MTPVRTHKPSATASAAVRPGPQFITPVADHIRDKRPRRAALSVDVGGEDAQGMAGAPQHDGLDTFVRRV